MLLGLVAAAIERQAELSHLEFWQFVCPPSDRVNEYKVIRGAVGQLIFKCSQIDVTDRFGSAASDHTILIYCGVSFGRRPPFLPLALAACSPACVRSRIRLRLNSASAPNR